MMESVFGDFWTFQLMYLLTIVHNISRFRIHDSYISLSLIGWRAHAFCICSNCLIWAVNELQRQRSVDNIAKNIFEKYE
jgi:hypothetical protein